jgi:hypothetical protein
MSLGSSSLRQNPRLGYTSIRAGRQPEMSLERALEDQRLMDQVYATI